MRRVLIACSLLTLLSAIHAADPTPDEVLSQYAESVTKAAEVLETVTDEKTATDAKPKLDELATKQAELKARIGKLTPDELSKASKTALSAMSESEQKLTVAHDRIFSKAKPAYKVLHGGKQFDLIEKRLEYEAEKNARMLCIQTKSYTAKNRGVFPQNLKALVDKTGGRVPLVDGGEKSLIDPWGAPYQYESGQITIEKMEVKTTYVWTVSPYSGKKLGTPPPEKK